MEISIFPYNEKTFGRLKLFLLKLGVFSAAALLPLLLILCVPSPVEKPPLTLSDPASLVNCKSNLHEKVRKLASCKSSKEFCESAEKPACLHNRLDTLKSTREQYEKKILGMAQGMSELMQGKEKLTDEIESLRSNLTSILLAYNSLQMTKKFESDWLKRANGIVIRQLRHASRRVEQSRHRAYISKRQLVELRKKIDQLEQALNEAKKEGAPAPQLNAPADGGDKQVWEYLDKLRQDYHKFQRPSLVDLISVYGNIFVNSLEPPKQKFDDLARFTTTLLNQSLENLNHLYDSVVERSSSIKNSSIWNESCAALKNFYHIVQNTSELSSSLFDNLHSNIDNIWHKSASLIWIEDGDDFDQEHGTTTQREDDNMDDEEEEDDEHHFHSFKSPLSSILQDFGRVIESTKNALSISDSSNNIFDVFDRSSGTRDKKAERVFSKKSNDKQRGKSFKVTKTGNDPRTIEDDSIVHVHSVRGSDGSDQQHPIADTFVVQQQQQPSSSSDNENDVDDDRYADDDDENILRVIDDDDDIIVKESKERRIVAEVKTFVDALKTSTIRYNWGRHESDYYYEMLEDYLLPWAADDRDALWWPCQKNWWSGFGSRMNGFSSRSGYSKLAVDCTFRLLDWQKRGGCYRKDNTNFVFSSKKLKHPQPDCNDERRRQILDDSPRLAAVVARFSARTVSVDVDGGNRIKYPKGPSVTPVLQPCNGKHGGPPCQSEEKRRKHKKEKVIVTSQERPSAPNKPSTRFSKESNWLFNRYNSRQYLRKHKDDDDDERPNKNEANWWFQRSKARKSYRQEKY